MGLCKCPKKKVTNQFCFEHRVNVCENCMVTDHTKCVVQSYLQWLDDSDYNPTCRICDDSLAEGDCIRLVCYDVFHRECLNSWAKILPSNTAPAGYKCPVCSNAIFPPSNLESPVAEALKLSLSEWPWARVGLGLSLLNDTPDSSLINNYKSTPENISSQVPRTHGTPPISEATPQQDSTTSSSQHSSYVTALSENPIIHPQHHSEGGGASGRKPSSSDAILMMNPDSDPDEDKYKRRPASEWFNRWWRTLQKPSSRHHQGLLGGKKRMIALLSVLGVISLFVLLSYLSRNREDDPALDPFNNPNIRVQEEE